MMEYFIYEYSRTRIVKRIKKELDLSFLDYQILREIQTLQSEEIEFRELSNLLIDRFQSASIPNISSNITSLSNKKLFSKKRSEFDERNLIIFDIRYELIDIIVNQVRLIIKDEIKKTAI